MTQLIVKPINLTEPGSYRARKQFLRVHRRLMELPDTTDAKTTFAVYEEIDNLLLSQLRTDDGTPVEDALDQLSAAQFDQLFQAIAFESGVGGQSAEPSGAGTGGTAASTPTG